MLARISVFQAALLISLFSFTSSAQAGSLEDLVNQYTDGRVEGATKIIEHTGRALEGAMRGQPFMSFNEWFNEVRDEVAHQRRVLSDSLRREPQDWINWSRTNVFSIRDTKKGLERLREAQKIVRDIESRCAQLEQIAIKKWAEDTAESIKNIPESMTSLKIADLAARSEALSELTRLKELARDASDRLETATEAVSETLDDMIRTREKFDRERFEQLEQNDLRPVPNVSSSNSRSSQNVASSSSATLRAWQSVPQNPSAVSNSLRPLHNPLAAKTEYRPPSGASPSGFRGVVMGGASSLDPSFFSGGGAGSGSVGSGRYSGPSHPLGRGGGWDNLPIPMERTTPSNLSTHLP